MEEEGKRIKQIQQSGSEETDENKEIDIRSVYVGNVDYSTTSEELQAHFQGCGTINRVTILSDKYTGHPKGFAYVEFAEIDSVENAVKLNDSTIHGRNIKVTPKRTNVPRFIRAKTEPGFRGGGRGRRSFRGRRPYYHPYSK